MTFQHGRLVSENLFEHHENGAITVDVLQSSSKQYYYDNFGRLVAERKTENYKNRGTVNTEITYLYDESSMVGFMYSANGSTPQVFYYQRNLQGDVVAIYDTNGVKQAGYTYDAYGNILSTYVGPSGIAADNPIRYRGYYYDSETGFYYLNSRYYSPEWRRFISPDDTAYIDPETPNGLNLYCYCNNDPVNYADPSGHFGIWAIIGIVGTAIVLGGGTQILSNAIAGETGTDLWRGVAGAALGSGTSALALLLSPFTGGVSLVASALLGASMQTSVDSF